MGRQKTTEEFIANARAVHGDRYNYSTVVYVKARLKVIIVCKEHGEFPQTPSDHLDGKGCKRCAGLMRKNREEFVADAIAVHGDRYDYSKVIYKNNHTKVTIVCKEHGEFPQTPNGHLRGQGCAECAGNAQRTTKDFIADAISVHGDRYDYTKTAYKNSSAKVIIICREHGEFRQLPHDHLNGHGCHACYKFRKTYDDFCADSIKLHNNKYDYSNVVYAGNRIKVIIICPEHGEFHQTPASHLSGCGCSKCAKYGFDPSKEATFYIYTFGNYAGFGITNNFDNRHDAHGRNFKKKNIDATLVTTYNMSGWSAQALERHLKKTLDIVDSGVEGFKTEAVIIQHLPKLILELEEHVNVSNSEPPPPPPPPY